MFERFTESARRAVFFARYEASQYGSPQIGTEHLLLGLWRERRAMMAKLFPGKSASESQIRAEVEKRIERGERIPTSADMPLSEENRNVLKLAVETADRLGYKHISPEHLLIAILHVGKSVAAQILKDGGVTSGPIEADLATQAREKLGSRSAPPPSFTLDHFLLGLKSLNTEMLVPYFAKNAVFIDGYGARWDRAAIEKEFETLFAAYAKKNATYIFEGTLAETSELYIVTVLWKNALLASEERAWMHRMTLVLTLEANEWKILFGQVTPVKPFSVAAN